MENGAIKRKPLENEEKQYLVKKDDVSFVAKPNAGHVARNWFLRK